MVGGAGVIPASPASPWWPVAGRIHDHIVITISDRTTTNEEFHLVV